MSSIARENPEWDDFSHEAIADRLIPVVPLLDCGHTVSPHSSITTGWASDSEGRTYCYECAAERDRETLKVSGHLFAYASGEGATVTITTWAGTKLGTARRTVSRAARKAYYSGTVAGVKVYGTGPSEDGTYVSLHAYKNQD